MPELPEIYLRAREADQALTGKTFVAADLVQPKCLNLPPAQFSERIIGERIQSARHRGKWVITALERHHLLLSLGMGGEMLLLGPDDPLPEKRQATFTFDDDTRLVFHFWWFGYIHLVPNDRLADHRMTSELGVDPLAPEFTVAALAALLAKRRTRIKSLLLDQKRIAGIGNMYSHDILFRAGLHPDRPANSLSEAEVQALWQSLRSTLEQAIALGGAKWEQSLSGEGGGYDESSFLVAYREGKPCPRCETPVAKIKTGSTAGFICPRCQPL